MKPTIIELLKTPQAVLCVLALALLAQMPHAADVFRLIVKPVSASEHIDYLGLAHSYSYAIALELAVLLFVVQNRQFESYGFAVVSVLVNLSYYGLHSINLFSWSAFPAYLISIALPVAIALYSHAVADSEQPEQKPIAKRVTRTVRNTQTVEQSEQFTVPDVQVKPVIIEQSPRAFDYKMLTDEQKREQFAAVVSGQDVPSKSKLADMFDVSRTTVYAWLREIEQA